MVIANEVKQEHVAHINKLFNTEFTVVHNVPRIPGNIINISIYFWYTIYTIHKIARALPVQTIMSMLVRGACKTFLHIYYKISSNSIDRGINFSMNILR